MTKNKICNSCKKEYPKTLDYFFAKKTKKRMASGEVVIYNGFRSTCKTCHGKKGDERRIEKRCKEMKCDVSEYHEKWKEQYTKTRTIDLKAKNELKGRGYDHYLKLKRDNEVSNYKEYMERVNISKENRTQRLVENVLSRQKYFTDKDKTSALRMYAKRYADRLTDSYVCNVLIGCKVSDLTPSIIETKRNIIKLKRELKKQ